MVEEQKKNAWVKNIPWYIWHIIGFIIAYFVLRYIWKCPLRFFFGISCPACGLTRAADACAHLHIKEAFAYHPLFPIAAAGVLYFVHRRILPWKLPLKVEKILRIVIFTIFILVYLVRIFIWRDPIVTMDWESGLIYKILSFIEEVI